jgi:hypothetical protein
MTMSTARSSLIRRTPPTPRQAALRPRRLGIEQCEDRLLLSADLHVAAKELTEWRLPHLSAMEWRALQSPPSSPPPASGPSLTVVASEGYIELCLSNASGQYSLRSFGEPVLSDANSGTFQASVITSASEIRLEGMTGSSENRSSLTTSSASGTPTASAIDETDTVSSCTELDPSRTILSAPQPETTMPRISQDDVAHTSPSKGLIDPTPRRDDPPRVVVDLTVERAIADRAEVQQESLSTASPDVINGARARGEAFDLAAKDLPLESLSSVQPPAAPQAVPTPSPDPTLLAESAPGPTPLVLSALAAHRSVLSSPPPLTSPPSNTQFVQPSPAALPSLTDAANQGVLTTTAIAEPLVTQAALHDAALTAEALSPTDEATGVRLETYRPRDLVFTLLIGMLAEYLTRDRSKRPPLKEDDEVRFRRP